MKIFKKWWWYSTGFYLPQIIWTNIKNLIKWFPLVWQDRDWDHFYILKTLQFKLKNTADYIEKRDRYVGCERTVEKLRLCVKLIDKLIDEDYQMEYQAYYEEELFTEDRYLKSTLIRNDLETYFKKYPNDYRRISSKYNDYSEVSKALVMGGMRHERANQLLFKIIANNLYNWWD